MRRWRWLMPLLLAAVPAPPQAQAQNPVVLDPMVALQRRTQLASARLTGGLALAQQKVQIDLELAAEEQRLNLRNAANGRATALAVALEVYRQSARDGQARHLLVQAVSTATQQYTQGCQQAYQVWQQAVNQTLQTCIQDGSAALQPTYNEYNGALQSFAQAMPNFDKEPDDLAGEFVQAGTPQPEGEAAKALATALQAARDKYAAVVKEADATWQQATRKAIQALRDKQLAEELAASQLRRANRVWITTLMDALDEMRIASRTALRQYQFAAVPD